MATIQWFISEISPSGDEISQVSTSWNTIRETIEWNLDFIWSSKLTGSYIRKTKISPIDDLDIIFHLKWMWDTYLEWKDTEQKECKIYIKSEKYKDHSLKSYVSIENDKYYISPTKILNKIKAVIKERYPQTEDIAKRWECITTYFPSYDITIDCMPYTWVSWETYILIPTSGNNLYWKKSNPDMDKDKINELEDENHFNWKLKWVIKVMKYWNKKKNSWISFRSYVLECVIYYSLKQQSESYNASYTDILKIVIKYLYNKKHHNILDIPWYDYIYYKLTDEQRQRIKWLLEILWNKLTTSEDDFISYLKS